MSAGNVRRGMPSVQLTKEEFGRRYRDRFRDPAFAERSAEIDALLEAAWQGYSAYRKSPHTRAAGAGFAEPDFPVAVEWLEARARIQAARERWSDPASAPRVLIVNGAARSDKTCPGEMSKTFRLVSAAESIATAEPGFEVEVLDLSRLVSEYGRTIHPCKTCVSTAMPLCHWPCSCYPNHALGQVNDWMADIYPMWVAAHGVMIVCPVNWYQAPSTLKLMIDRLVCADGGNPDPTSTHGKDPERAKALELAGWDYPRHLAGRVYSVVVHGDTDGVETLRRGLCDWLSDMGLIAAGSQAQLGRYVGYYGPYADSHDKLDEDTAFQEEVRNAARALVDAVKMLRRGTLVQPGAGLSDPRPK